MQHSHRFFENKDCQYFPCHDGLHNFNCLFCCCPMYARKDCLGSPQYKESNGKKMKDCSSCIFPHKPENYDMIMSYLMK